MKNGAETKSIGMEDRTVTHWYLKEVHGISPNDHTGEEEHQRKPTPSRGAKQECSGGRRTVAPQQSQTLSTTTASYSKR